MTDFPNRITIELTNHCNLTCVFCPRSFMEKKRGYMPRSLAFKILDEIAQHPPVTLVPFFRGESLLHPDWDSILERANSLAISPVQLATNASLLTEERARRILDLRIDFLSFSMDTLDPDEYEKLRGTNYQASLENVLRFLHLRSIRNKGPFIQISTVNLEESEEKISAFVEYWLPKVDRVRVYKKHSMDGTPGSLTPPPLPRDQRRPCLKVMGEMVVYWNGDVALCNHDWTRRLTGQYIGNLASDSIEKIWTGESYQAIRSAHMSGKVAGILPCQNCDHWAVPYLPEKYWGRVFENG